MGMIYPHTTAIIGERVAAIYGTKVHLARGLGISRQALDVRIRSTLGSPYLHEWWEQLLGLRPGSLAAGVSPTEDLDPIRAAVALQAAVDAWPRVFAGRLSYPSLKRLQSNEAKRKPRAKRVAGCEPKGGAQ